MKILVTGASGFVASHLLPVLAGDGHVVRAASRRPPSICGIESVAAPELGPDADWRPALQGVDAVVHLAARAHISSESAGVATENLYQRVNAEGTATLAHQAALSGVTRFVFLSSCHSVAALASEALTPDTSPHPTTPYGRSKLAAEEAVRGSMGSGRFTIIRPPLVYGPGNLANFAKLAWLVGHGIPLPFGAVHNRRSFLGAANLADFVRRCLSEPAAAGQVFLPSDGRDVSTPELIHELAFALGRTARLVPVPESVLTAGASIPGFALLSKLAGSLFLDQTHVREQLGWTPPFTFQEGLRFLSGGKAMRKP